LPQLLIVIILAVVFTAVLSVGQGAYWASVAKKEKDERELLRRLGMLAETGGSQLFRDRTADATAIALGSIGAHLQASLEAADSKTRVGGLMGQMVGVGAGAFLLTAAFSGNIVGAVAVGLVFAMAPYLLLKRSAANRAAKLIEQLPDALDLMARSLQAGLGLLETFRTVAEEMPLPIAQEFGRVFEEIRLGRDYREALGNMIERNPSTFDLRLFVSSVLLQRETGGNLIEILDNISGTIRARFIFQAKVRALTSEARFSALILGGLPLVVAGIVSVSNPDYLDPLFSDPLGNFFLLYFFLSYCFGGFLMMQVSKVEV
jgi:tight adherence protein B